MKLKKYYKKLCILITGVIAFNLSSLMVSANANTLNIETFISLNECQVYGMPGAFSRLSSITSRVYGYYLISNGIHINFNFFTDNEHIRRTLLETCSDGLVGRMKYVCPHWMNPECRNGIISNPSIKHHTNVYNVMNQLPNSTTNYAVMLLTPNYLCMQTTNNHLELIGKCWRYSDKLIVEDFDYFMDDDYSQSTHTATIDYAAFNMVHEIGHLYCVNDHYNQSYGIEKDNCIWGINRFKNDVYKRLVVCDDCAQTIKNNKGKYNHTPID